MLLVTVVTCAIIAIFAAGTAVLVHRVDPDRTAREISGRAVFWVIIVLFGLVALLLLESLSTTCSQDGGACDAGAMAAAGVVMLGSLGVVICIVVGGPIAYATASWMKRR